MSLRQVTRDLDREDTEIAQSEKNLNENQLRLRDLRTIFITKKQQSQFLNDKRRKLQVARTNIYSRIRSNSVSDFESPFASPQRKSSLLSKLVSNKEAMSAKPMRVSLRPPSAAPTPSRTPMISPLSLRVPSATISPLPSPQNKN